jgi:voltage-gated potassium channel
LGRTVNTLARQERFDHFVAATELPIATLALLIAPVLVIESHATSALARTSAHAANWGIWVAFCGEYITKVALAPNRRAFVKRAWLDLLIVVLSVPGPVTGVIDGVPARVVGLVRFTRGATVAWLGLKMRRHVLRPNRFHYAFATTVIVLGLGAMGIFTVEHGVNDHIRTFGDALWWSVVTATTVGYGDVSPVTPEGRLIAVGLMLLGIGFVGVFTATVSSFFFDQGRVGQVDDRLARIEAKLDLLQRQMNSRSVRL